MKSSLVFTALLLACGSPAPSGGLDCSPTFTACGGDPTGAWQYQGRCNVQPPHDPTCPNLLFVTDETVVSAYTFDAGGAFSSTSMYGGGSTTTYPGWCTSAIPSCDKWSSTTAGPPMVMRMCTGDSTSTGCVCQDTYSGTASHSGTWQTANGQLMLTVDGVMAMGGYCVQGTTLELAYTVFDATGSGSTAYAVFARK